MNPALIKVESDALVLVEGKTAAVFFGVMLEKMGKSGPQVIDFGGIAELAGKLQRVARDPAFVAKGRSLAIIRDAEKNARSAFDSVVYAVNAVGLVAAGQPGKWADGKPAVGIFILPDNQSPGMLESLCLGAVKQAQTGAGKVACLEEYLACLQKTGGSDASLISDKARMQSLLAGVGVQNPQVGAAARANYFDFASPAFAGLKEFLSHL